MNKCKQCGSYAINPHLYERDNTDLDLCDVHYWMKRAAQPQVPEDCVLVTVCSNGFTSAKLIPIVIVQSSNMREVARYADQAWQEIESAMLTATQQEKNGG